MVARPPAAGPGRPAPWAELEVGERRGLSLGRVEAALERAGRAGSTPPADDDPPGAWADGSATPLPGALRAAVLVALFEEAGESRLVLTRRSTALRSHRGEVSLPGGRLEAGESPATAARREAAEEVGIDPSWPRPAGWLHPVQTYSSVALVLPVVATLPGRPELVANPDEVERVFDVALAELAADGTLREERWRAGAPARSGASADGSYAVWFFDAAGETIWGATARIVYELVSLTLGVDSSATAR